METQIQAEIVKQEHKPLVERTEVLIKIENFKATPSRKEVEEISSELLKKPKELIVIRRIHQKFGKAEALATIYVYDNKEALEKFGRKKVKEEKQEKSEEKEVEKKTEEKQEKSEEKGEKSEEEANKK